jgi:uncharacterized protein
MPEANAGMVAAATGLEVPGPEVPLALSKNTVVLKLRERNGRQLNCLVFNLLKGNADLISEEFLAEASDTDLNRLSEPARNFRLRYSVSSPEHERHLEEALYGEYMAARQTASKPYFLLVPTYNCNTACAYCWQTALHGQTSVITQATLARSFEAMEALIERFGYSGERPTVEIFGGEPLQPHSIGAVHDILAAVAARGWDSVITTNGSLLDCYAEELLAYENLLGVHVTVDGPHDIHNASRPMKDGGDGFSSIMAGLAPFLRDGRRVVMRCNLNAANAPHLPALLSNVRDRGWLDLPNFECAIEPVTDNSGDRHELNAPGLKLVKQAVPLLREFPEIVFSIGHCGSDLFNHLLNLDRLPTIAFHRCGAENGTLFLLDLHGDIYNCFETAGFKKHAVGRFLPEFELFPALKKWHRRNVLETPGCRDCAVKFVCGGGCAWNAFNKFGTINHSMCPPIYGQMQYLFDHYYDALAVRT